MDTTTKRGEPVIKLEGHRWCAIEEWCERGGGKGVIAAFFKVYAPPPPPPRFYTVGVANGSASVQLRLHAGGTEGTDFLDARGIRYERKKRTHKKKISHRRRQRSTAPASDNSQYTHTNIAQTRNRVKIAAPEIITLKYNLDWRGERKYA